MPETWLTSFLALSVHPPTGISWSASETVIDFIFFSLFAIDIGVANLFILGMFIYERLTGSVLQIRRGKRDNLGIISILLL